MTTNCRLKKYLERKTGDNKNKKEPTPTVRSGAKIGLSRQDFLVFCSFMWSTDRGIWQNAPRTVPRSTFYWKMQNFRQDFVCTFQCAMSTDRPIFTPCALQISSASFNLYGLRIPFFWASRKSRKSMQNQYKIDGNRPWKSMKVDWKSLEIWQAQRRLRGARLDAPGGATFTH